MQVAILLLAIDAFKKVFETSDLTYDPQADDAFSSFPISPLDEADCVLIQRQMCWVLRFHNFGTLRIESIVLLFIVYQRVGCHRSMQTLAETTPRGEQLMTTI